MMEQNNEWLIGKNALKEGIAAGKRIQKVYLSDTLIKVDKGTKDFRSGGP
jgi:hypothetical protein